MFNSVAVFFSPYAILFFASRFLDHHVRAVVVCLHLWSNQLQLTAAWYLSPQKTIFVGHQLHPYSSHLPTIISHFLPASKSCRHWNSCRHSGPNPRTQRRAASERWNTWLKLLQMYLRELMTYTVLTFPFCICMVNLTMFYFVSMHPMAWISWLLIGVIGSLLLHLS